MKINPFSFANERTEMKLKIYLSEAWMCSEFGMLITDVERERVKRTNQVFFLYFPDTVLFSQQSCKDFSMMKIR